MSGPDDLAGALAGFVGRRAQPDVVAADAVDEAVVRHWCEVMGDANPVYVDRAAAAGSVHGGLVAPPAMLQTWCARGLRPRPPAGPDSAEVELIALLASNGFASVVATDTDQEHVRYLRPGDRLASSTVIEDVSDRKQTRLGEGYFITTATTFRDADGEVVARLRYRTFRFRPAAGSAPAPAPAPGPTAGARPRPAIGPDNAFFWEGVRQGRLLIQRCTACGRLRHPPRPVCPHCLSTGWDTVESSGRGVVHSFTVPAYPELPGFDHPYVVVLVQLEEGTRLLSDLVDVDARLPAGGGPPPGVAIGLPVRVVFRTVDGDLVLPQFVPDVDRAAPPGGAPPPEPRPAGSQPWTST